MLKIKLVKIYDFHTSILICTIIIKKIIGIKHINLNENITICMHI